QGMPSYPFAAHLIRIRVSLVSSGTKTKAPQPGGAFFALICELLRQARESRDRPMLNAFWRVAPSVRFRDRAIRDAFVFFRAAAFKVRTSVVVHARRFDFLAIQTSPSFDRVRRAL